MRKKSLYLIGILLISTATMMGQKTLKWTGQAGDNKWTTSLNWVDESDMEETPTAWISGSIADFNGVTGSIEITATTTADIINSSSDLNIVVNAEHAGYLLSLKSSEEGRIIAANFILQPENSNTSEAALVVSSTSEPIILSGKISGKGGITSSQTYILTNENSFERNTVVQGGELILSGNGTFGAGNVYANNGELRFQRDITVSNSINFMTTNTRTITVDEGYTVNITNGINSQSNGSGWTKAGKGTLIISGKHTTSYPGYNEDITLTIEEGILEQGGTEISDMIYFTKIILTDGEFRINRDADLTLSANISGSAPIIKQGTAALVLKGNNDDCSSPITIQKGSVKLADNGTLGSGIVTLDGGLLVSEKGITPFEGKEIKVETLENEPLIATNELAPLGSPITFDISSADTEKYVLIKSDVNIENTENALENIEIKGLIAGTYRLEIDETGKQIILNNTPDTPSPIHHTITLEVAPGIDLYNLTAGNHTIEEGGHLHLQFLPEDPAATTDNILFLVDGIETPFKDFGGGNYFSYILNPVTADHTILVAMREYTVTLSGTKGVTFNVGPGEHAVTYGEPFTFSLTLDEGIDETAVHIYANGIEIQPDPLRSITLSYTIDKVIGPITVLIEGTENPTGNTRLTDTRIYGAGGQLVIETAAAQNAQVYSLTGSLVANRQVNGRDMINLKPGVYIVRIKEVIQKVVVH